jgi:hypothetical protein
MKIFIEKKTIPNILLYSFGIILVLISIYLIFDHRKMTMNNRESFNPINEEEVEKSVLQELTNNLEMVYPTLSTNPSIPPSVENQMINATQNNYIQNIKNVAAIKAREVEIQNLSNKLNDINKTINFNINNMKLS